MMKQLAGIILFALLLHSCGNRQAKENTPATKPAEEKEKPVFFPVTNFIEGQIYELKTVVGVTPMLFDRTPGRQPDSSWLKVEEFDKTFAPFLEPRIDSAGMSACFTEKSFMDETIGLVTMTYERKNDCPDSVSIREWTVYIDPETDKVKRIYIVRQRADTSFRLTWVPGKYAQFIEINEKEHPSQPILKDVSIKWSF